MEQKSIKFGQEAAVFYSELGLLALTLFHDHLRPKICNANFNRFMFPSTSTEGVFSLSSLTAIMKKNKLPSGKNVTSLTVRNSKV